MKFVSWNIEGRLSRFAEAGQRGSPEHIVQSLEKLSGDIVFLAEASDGDTIEPETVVRLKDLGYEIYTVDYNDAGTRRWPAEAAPNMKLLTRLELTSFTNIRLGGIRNALTAVLSDPDTGRVLRVFGVHLDDRNELNRLRMVDDLVTHVAESSLPTIVMGDYNAMHGNSWQARLLKTWWASQAARFCPHPRIQDQLLRLIEMADGRTLARLEQETGLRDADHKRCGTATPKMRSQEWIPSVRGGQIDHIMTTSGLTISQFSVSPDNGSDHRAIAATIDIASD